MKHITRFLSPILLILLLVFATAGQLAEARFGNNYFSEPGFQDLIYGASTPMDVQSALGQPPDEVVKTESMYPVIENHYYYADDGSGAATVFVFENGLLMGMSLKTAENQFIDLSYFLIDNGDRRLNAPLRAGYRGFYPIYPLYEFR